MEWSEVKGELHDFFVDWVERQDEEKRLSLQKSIIEDWEEGRFG